MKICLYMWLERTAVAKKMATVKQATSTGVGPGLGEVHSRYRSGGLRHTLQWTKCIGELDMEKIGYSFIVVMQATQPGRIGKTDRLK